MIRQDGPALPRSGNEAQRAEWERGMFNDSLKENEGFIQKSQTSEHFVIQGSIRAS